MCLVPAAAFIHQSMYVARGVRVYLEICIFFRYNCTFSNKSANVEHADPQ